MKIFIDTNKWVIVKEEKESPFYEGENFASKLRIYINDNGTTYPSLSILKANGRKRGPFNYDASGYGVEDVDGSTWNYFEFTLSTINGILDVPGQLLMTCVLNTNGIQRTFNITNNVVKTAVNSDAGIIAYGDDPMEVVRDFSKNLDALSQNINANANAISEVNNQVNASHTELNELLKTKANTEYVDNTITDFKDNLESQINEVKYDLEKLDEKFLIVDEEDVGIYTDGIVDIEAYSDINLRSTEGEVALNGNYHVRLESGPNELILNGDGLKLNAKEIALKEYVDEKTTITLDTKINILNDDGSIRDYAYLDDYFEKNESDKFTGFIRSTRRDAKGNIIDETYATKQDIADLVNSAPETLDTLGELAQALQENEDVVQVINQAITTKADEERVSAMEMVYDNAIVGINEAITNKADKTDVPTKLSDLKIDMEIGGVSEEQVLDILENNSIEADTMTIGNSSNFDITNDNQIPTTKAVVQMIESVINSVLEAEY